MRIQTTIAILLAASTSIAVAGKGTDLKPALATPGKVTVEDTFAGSELGKAWNVAKGEWHVRDGALVGSEKQEDKHAGVCALNQPNHDSIIRFSFKFDGSKELSLSYNQKAGHLFRVNIEPTGIAVNKDKDKKDADSKGAALGHAEIKFEPGQWYTVLVEVKGGKVAVTTDNGVHIESTEPSLDVDKTGYRFVTRGASVAIADVKAWDAVP